MSDAVSNTFAALADPTRRGVIELLRNGPLRAGELSSALDMNKPALTRHLRVLRESGLVQEASLGEDARVRTAYGERRSRTCVNGSTISKSGGRSNSTVSSAMPSARAVRKRPLDRGNLHDRKRNGPRHHIRRRLAQ
jgi:DNA-binding transcriptional ArsR family regulator